MLEDNTLEAFVEKYLDSLLTWDIVVNLHRQSCPNITELATRLGRQPNEVETVLTNLEAKGLVVNGGPDRQFSLASGFKDELQLFTAAIRDRQTRLAILSKVLDRQTFGGIDSRSPDPLR